MLRNGLLLIFVMLALFLTNAFAIPLSQVEWKAKAGTVALTFDDGPNPLYTPQVLDILKKNHVHATFFVMGWAARKYPDLIKRMLLDGHAVASHTNSHKMLTKLSAEKLHHEVVETKAMIAKAAGKEPVCLRPPFGVGNKTIGDYIRRNGMIMVPMGFNSFDYQRLGVQKLISWVIKNAHSGQVILLHDGPKAREQTVEALPMIIEGIRKKGLEFSVICKS